MTQQFEGCAYFRQRLVLSTLSCTPIKIKNIRTQDNEPGLRGKNLRSILSISDLFRLCLINI